MKGSLSESTLWATELAARLRFLQSSLLHDVPETRERVLNKEISRALKPLAPQKQKQCLEVLAAQFPVPEPFTARCELEEERRKILAEKDAAVRAIAEKEAALGEMKGSAENYRKLYEEFQKSQRDLEKAKQDLQKLQERLTETRAQYDGQFVVLKKERDAALQQRDELTPARQRDAAQMARMAEELRRLREGGGVEQGDGTEALEQARAEAQQVQAEKEQMRTKLEAQLAALKKERDAAIRQRDEEAARGGAMRGDPQTLVDGLLQVLPQATEEQTSALVAGLQDAGLIPAGEPGSVKIPKELKERLQKISMTRSVDPTRGLRALEILIDFAWNVDQLVWHVWREVAPKSVIRVDPGRFGDLRKCLAPYITGDTEVNAEQVKQAVEKTRKLVAGLLTSMGKVGQTFSGILGEKLSPAAIKKLVDGEGGGIFEAAEKRYWKKYNDLFPKLNAPAIEKDAFNSIQKYTEKLVLGAEAPNLENE